MMVLEMSINVASRQMDSANLLTPTDWTVVPTVLSKQSVHAKTNFSDFKKQTDIQKTKFINLKKIL